MAVEPLLKMRNKIFAIRFVVKNESESKNVCSLNCKLSYTRICHYNMWVRY